MLMRFLCLQPSPLECTKFEEAEEREQSTTARKNIDKVRYLYIETVIEKINTDLKQLIDAYKYIYQ